MGLKDPPVKTNMVPRVIPSQAWYLNLLFTMLIGGILPFGAVFIELYFIMSSVWLQRFYYVFGFLALVLFILLVTCGEMAIVLCYFQLCNENYLWQWRAFLNTGSAGIFLFAQLCLLFLDPRDHGRSEHHALLRLHVRRFDGLPAGHGDRGIHVLLVVRAADLRRRQGGLSPAAKKRGSCTGAHRVGVMTNAVT